MPVDLIVRFLLGGLIVSAFALLGDLFRPKSFAGLFSAAPSVALASLGLASTTHDGAYLALEGRSMIAGAVGLCVYSLVVSHVLLRSGEVLLVASSSVVLWFLVALGLWALFLR